MKIKLTHIATTLLLIAGGLGTVTSLQSNSGGITGRSVVGCGGGGCHSATAATTIVGITNLPSGYTAGQTYSLTVSVGSTSSSHTAAGIDMTVSGGTLSNPGPGATLNGTTEFRHTTPKAISGSVATFTVDWTAPATGSGTITFNMAGNAVNQNGATSGDVYNVSSQQLSEGTAAVDPTVTTGSASGITAVSAVLNGTANANGGTYGVGFQYGTSTSYGSNVLSTTPVLSGSSTVSETATANGLMSSTLYHFRLVAVSTSSDTTFGADMTFTTLSSTGVATVQSAGIRFFPNPTADRLTVDVRNTVIDIQEVRVADMTGKVLSVTSTKTASGYEISTAALPAGQYHLLVADKNGKLLASVFTKQ